METFTVVVVMTIVATLTVPNGVADSGLDVNFVMKKIPTVYATCPPNVTADFDVIFNHENSSTVKGCASLEFRSSNESTNIRTFGLRFGRLNNDGPRVCVSGDYAGMEELMFSCISPSATSPVKFDNGKVYRLYGDAVTPAGNHETRCISYKMVNSVLSMMAVGSNTSCGGLTHMLFYSHANSPKGSMLLRLNRSGGNLRRRRSAVKTKNSTNVAKGYFINILRSFIFLY